MIFFFFRYLVYGCSGSDKQSPDIFTYIVILYSAREFNILKVIKDAYRTVKFVYEMSSLIGLLLGQDCTGCKETSHQDWGEGKIYG